ncbi:hypothetical protein M3Y97_00290900 [Aphelenchoides bicaudatus]|nr:hypothetical protein M3Y97_00290900 [Aphelenchoides bicaudatus]
MDQRGLIIFVLLIPGVFGQYSAMDRTQQELNLMDWSAGFLMAYCQHANIVELIEPFKEAMVRMTNRFCRNATACRLEKPVTFTKYQIVLLDGFPKRKNRDLNTKMEKPYLSIKILTEILRTQSSELTNRLGWQLISKDKYPRFDQITTFMNLALIPIGVIAGLLMLFLAYWSNKIVSGSSIYSGEGWMVSGSTGGKNAALRRTMEIIEEQKYRFDHMEKHRASGENVYIYTAVPRPGMTIPREERELQLTAAQLPRDTFNKSSSAAEDEEDFGSEAQDKVPEIVIMHARDSSRDSGDGTGSRRTSGAGHRRQSHGRRFSVFDTVKSKPRAFFSGGSRPERHKRWKTGNIMLNQFGSKESGGGRL